MQTLTLIIAVAALIIAVVALYRTGGIRNLREQMDRISTKTEGAAKVTREATREAAKVTREAAKATREVAADALERVEQLVRGKPKTPATASKGNKPPTRDKAKIAPKKEPAAVETVTTGEEDLSVKH
ncbi:MAG: hypothetical protein OES46_09405 [Gammaproteobacteria bacterium]|nr:hypothetical protein [Gammaproteobacteria bacterium]